MRFQFLSFVSTEKTNHTYTCHNTFNAIFSTVKFFYADGVFCRLLFSIAIGPTVVC